MLLKTMFSELFLELRITAQYIGTLASSMRDLSLVVLLSLMMMGLPTPSGCKSCLPFCWNESDFNYCNETL